MGGGLKGLGGEVRGRERERDMAGSMIHGMRLDMCSRGELKREKKWMRGKRGKRESDGSSRGSYQQEWRRERKPIRYPRIRDYQATIG